MFSEIDVQPSCSLMFADHMARLTANIPSILIGLLKGRQVPERRDTRLERIYDEVSRKAAHHKYLIYLLACSNGVSFVHATFILTYKRGTGMVRKLSFYRLFVTKKKYVHTSKYTLVDN